MTAPRPPAWPFRLAVIGLTGALAVLTWIAVRAGGGAFVFPLDDAYIHLAVARRLAEDGTWGINPGTFANASSSPAWTVLLAALFAVTRPSPGVAWGVNAAAAITLLAVVSRGLRAEQVGPRLIAVTLCALVVFVPLPFLAALGMEHVAHAAVALALLLANLRGPADPAGSTARIATLAACVTLLRYEATFLVLSLAVVAAIERRWARVLALLGGSGGAVAGFAAFSLVQGGAWAPNGVLKKANLGAWAGVHDAVVESAGLLMLVGVVGVGALLTREARDRKLAAVLVGTTTLQLILGRVGWLARYEAWLVGLGVVSAALVLGRLQRTRPALAHVLAVLPLVPLTTRAVDAVTLFGPAVRFCASADVAVGEWLADTFPGETVAVHDLGAAAFYAQGPIVDVGGLGTEDLARLHREHHLTPDTVATALAAHGARLAVTGFTWPGDARPPGITEAARIFVPFPVPPGEFGVVVWTLDPALTPRVHAALPDLPLRAGRFAVEGGTDLRVDEAERSGGAVVAAEGGLTFYTNGTATLTAPHAGAVQVAAGGSPAGGRLPRYAVTVGGHTTALDADGPTLHPAGTVRAGDPIDVRYDDDLEQDGHDRNLFLRRVVVVPD